MAQSQLEDPTPSNFRKQALVVAIVLVILGVLVVLFASVVTGGIIAVLGGVFGLASQVGGDV